MTGRQREFAVGDRVIRRYTAAKYGAGTVIEIVPHYRIEWDNGFEPAAYCPEALDPAPRPPLAGGDTFGGFDPRADDLPVGTVVVVDDDVSPGAWVCRDQRWWCSTSSFRFHRLSKDYRYKIIHMPEVES